MSLLDDVSIVVTPNGYKAGELYAVVPVPSEGAEEITNGDFDGNTTGWTEVNINTTFSPLLFTNTANNGSIRQNFTTIVGRRYKLSGDIVSGAWTLYASTSTSTGGSLGSITSSGSLIFTATTTTTYILCYLIGASGTEGVTNNISVKEYTSADMDVTRATAATRVDENGLVNYAEVLGGEEVTNGDFANGETGWSFSSGWSVVNEEATTTGVALTPISQSVLVNGTNRLTFDVISGGAFVYTNYPSFSKKGDFLTLGTHTIDLESDGVGTNQLLYIYNNGAGNSLTLDNVSVKEVTRDNVPRIDYTGGGCPHILAEPQRTNIITYSNSNNLNFALDNVSMAYNSVVSPDGTTNGILFKQTGTNNSNSAYNYGLTTADGTYTYSIFLKSSDSESIRIYSSNGAVTLVQNFNPQTMTEGILAGNLNLNFQDYGGGWFRMSFTRTLSSAANHRLSIYPDRNNTQKGLYIYGIQVEVGSYPTSYIPTSGSTVTRNQDIFTRDGIGSLINSTEGVLFVEAKTTYDSSTSRRITLSDGSTSNRVSLEFDETTENVIKAFITLNGASETLVYTAPNLSIFNKIAIKWKANDFAIWFNGSAVVTETAEPRVPTGLTELVFDGGNGANFFFGKVKQLQVYNTALTDEQLLQLTGTSGTDFYESYAEMASALTYTIQ